MTGPANQVQIEASHIFGDSSRGVLYLSDGTRGGIQQISPMTIDMYYQTAAPTMSPTNNPTQIPTSQPTGQPTSSPTTTPVVHYESTYKIGVESSELTDNDKKTICQTILETTVPKPNFCEIIAVTFAPVVINRRRLKQVKPLDVTVDVTARLDYDLINFPTYTVHQLTETVTAALENAVEDKSFSTALTANAETNDATHLQDATVAAVNTITGSVTNPDRQPTGQPSRQPTSQPTNPTSQPTRQPTSQPTNPTSQPTRQPTSQPTSPTSQPTRQPTCQPTRQPTPQITTTMLDPVLTDPKGIWTDSVGNIYVVNVISPVLGHQVYKQTPEGEVSVFAGVSTAPGNSEDNDLATLAQLNTPTGMWVDHNNLYICDSTFGRIRVVNFRSNKISTIVGGGGDEIDNTDRSATSVRLRDPQSIWGDGRGSLYILTFSQVLIYSMTDETVQILAYSTTGAQTTGSNGAPVEFMDLAKVSVMAQITGDATRNCLYVTEQVDKDLVDSVIIRKLDLTMKRATIFAGQYGLKSTVPYPDNDDTLATNIKFSGYTGGPAGLWVAQDGTVFVADPGTQTISAIDPNTNKIKWFAGTWNEGGGYNRADSDYIANALHMDGPARLANIDPMYLTGNSALDTLYLVDRDHKAVRKISLLFTSSAPPAGRRLKEMEDEMIPSSKHSTLQLPKKYFHLRGSV
jgi:cell division septation protein DedD